MNEHVTGVKATVLGGQANKKKIVETVKFSEKEVPEFGTGRIAVIGDDRRRRSAVELTILGKRTCSES